MLPKRVAEIVIVLISLVLYSTGSVSAGDKPGPSFDQPSGTSLGTDQESLYLRTGPVNLREMPSLLVSGATFAPTRRYVIQLDGPITPQRRAFLEQAGVVLGPYLPMNAYVADLSRANADALIAAGFVRWVGQYDEAWKLSSTIGLVRPVTPERLQLAAAGKKRLVVSLFPGADLAAAKEGLRREGTELRAVGGEGRKHTLVVDAPDAKIRKLARNPDVMFIEEALEAEPRNATTTWICQSDVTDSVPLWNAGLHGENQIAGIIDWDLRADQCAFVDTVNPIGPLHRKIVSYYGMGISPGYGYHGTHVGGVLAGDELAGTNPNLKGMAYKSRFVFQHYNGVLVGGVLYVNDRLTVAHNDGARVHSNSWGSDSTRDYGAWSRDIDVFTRANEDDLVLIAVTNSNMQVTVPENSKNGLAVAATSDTPNEGSRCYGGYGPTTDGRQKPEVWAPGCGSISADYYTQCGTHSGGGTSYAAPAVSGFAVLVRQYFMEGFYPSGAANAPDAFTPSGALLKAVMVNSAVDMSGMAGYFTPAEGWGRILMDDVLYFPGDARKLLVTDVRNAAGLNTGDTNSYYFGVQSSTQRLKVTLVWTDVPAELSASFTPINNLDLVVTDPYSTAYLGNVFSGGQSSTGGSADIRNNVEQVHRDAPNPGRWRIDVLGTAVNQDRQGYALVVTGDVFWFCGDFDGDGDVDSADYGYIRDGLGHCAPEPEYMQHVLADIDGDGCITLADYQRWLRCYRTCARDPLAPPPGQGLIGDVNGDGKIDGLDVSEFVDTLLNPAAASPRQFVSCDFNGDGSVNGSDVQAFVNALLGQ
ncbi:MAG TPA: S8 family serine peptidase [Phycisphaerae bacterium]|nr:S8 family serine peptidase [Phycisphaerae bacterium]